MIQTPTLDRSVVTSIVESIGSLSAEVERLVANCNLTSIWSNAELEALPENNVWKLFRLSALSLDMPDVGLRVGGEFQVRDLGMFGRKLESSLTTNSCLQEYIKTVNRYSSHSKFWTEQEEGGVWFCRRGIDLIDVGRNEVEQFTLELMIRLVQLACGPMWKPRKVRIQHATDQCFRGHSVYGCVELLYGQPVTAIWLSDVDRFRIVRWRDDDVTGRVRDHVRVQMHDCKPDLALVAQQLGFSVRTLQRELSDRGLDWSRLLEQVRLNHAATSLADELPICEIAHSLGYTDQANFGRAFRRWTGTTPNSYRRRFRNAETP